MIKYHTFKLLKHCFFFRHKYKLDGPLIVNYPDVFGGVEQHGRSAGLSTAMAIYSLVSDQELDHKAFTGELTLTG